jgi:[NiFe] hydrogenase assembly HybE family chaperone
MTAAARLAQRVAALEAAFGHIARTRMHGMPLLHPALRVQAVGFQPDADFAHATGVLLTPWFMNLLRLPLRPGAQPLALGQRAPRPLGGRHLEFLGAFEPGVGAFETCSLFSPMCEFIDQAAAVATAREVLAALRAPPAAPARRSFLLGRAGAAP